MTKQEAIKLIDDRMCFGRGKWSEHHMPEIDDYWKAGKMAIKALEEPEPKTGKWIKPTGMMPPEYMGVYRCSECGEIAMRDWKRHYQTLTNYCPNCGAKMRGDEHD